MVYAEKALIMRNSSFGENADHPDIAESYEQISHVYVEKGLQEASVAYQEKSAAMKEAVKDKFVKDINL